MTWLGKILTFVVLIGSVVWAYFTVQAFVTRTNWKNELDRYKTAFKASESERAAELARYQAKEDALKRLLVSEQRRTDDLAKQVESLGTAAKKSTDDYKNLQQAFEQSDVKATQLATNVDNTLKELDTVRARNTTLEDERVKLVIAREEALKEKVRAENAKKLAEAIADDNAKKVEELTIRVNELKATGGSGAATVLRSLEKAPPEPPSNLRGEIARVEGDLVQITVGIDAGVSKGTVLQVDRLDGGGRFVGTIRVVDVYPKAAVAVFQPARPNTPIERLRPEELPKKGDLVRPTQ